MPKNTIGEGPGFDFHLGTKDLPPGVARVELNGHFTVTYAEHFKTAVKQLLSDGIQCLELDCANLTYLDSPAISAIVALQKACEEAGAKMKIVNPRKLVRHILLCAHLDRSIDIGPALEKTGGPP